MAYPWSWLPVGYSRDAMGYPWTTHGLFIGYAWAVHGPPTCFLGYLLYVHGLPMGHPGNAYGMCCTTYYGMSMGRLWATHGTPMGYAWTRNVIGLPWATPGMPMGCTWGAHGMPVDSSYKLIGCAWPTLGLLAMPWHCRLRWRHHGGAIRAHNTPMARRKGAP